MHKNAAAISDMSVTGNHLLQPKPKLTWTLAIKTPELGQWYSVRGCLVF
jgi:hypothetical protein